VTGILAYALVFYSGLILGFLLKTLLMHRFKKYSGTMLITKGEGKTVYSLVLDDYPEKLEFRKQILFKVEASEESFNRE
jgi:hypothetical protein